MQDKGVAVINNIHEWFNVGPVSAEKDKNLKNYFYDAGVSEEIVNDHTRYLILGRKGAGKTAVFMHLKDRPKRLFKETDAIVPLSTDDFHWRAHQALSDPYKSNGAQYRDSWRLVMAIESIRGLSHRLDELNQKAPRNLRNAQDLLKRLFGDPVPRIGDVIKQKILRLSTFRLPSMGVDLEEFSFDGGELSFDAQALEADQSLKATLAYNIENLTNYLETKLINSIIGCRVFLIFDRIDEEWLPDNKVKSKQLIGGLLHAAEYLTEKSNGKVRPVVFLREDIFEELDTINDKNKLRADCSRTLMWDKDRIEKLILRRINYFSRIAGGQEFNKINEIFTEAEISEQDKQPMDYIYFRTLCRPRDAIAYFNKIVDVVREDLREGENPIDSATGRLHGGVVKDAEGAYSDYLYNEIDDEWKVQKPAIKTWLEILANLDARVFTFKDFQDRHREKASSGFRRSLSLSSTSESTREVLKFMFDSSIVGYQRSYGGKVYYHCFNVSRKFEDVENYYVHKGLAVNLGLPECAN